MELDMQLFRIRLSDSFSLVRFMNFATWLAPGGRFCRAVRRGGRRPRRFSAALLICALNHSGCFRLNGGKMSAG